MSLSSNDNIFSSQHFLPASFNIYYTMRAMCSYCIEVFSKCHLLNKILYLRF